MHRISGILIHATSTAHLSLPSLQAPLIQQSRLPFQRGYHNLIANASKPFLRPQLSRTALPRKTLALSRVEPCVQHTRHWHINTSTASMDLNGETRQKRKSSPVNIKDRPAKLLRPGISNILNGDMSSEGGSDFIDGSEMGETVMQPPTTATADTAEWQATIEQVVKNVVSIHFCQTCSFDTDPAISSEATGFVVDAKRGYILTNRHVVGAGPFWGYCIFDNHEEVG